MSDDASADATSGPALRVVRGDPDPEQLAALLAVVTASGGEPEPAPVLRRGRWADPAGLTRRVSAPGPGAWRAAGR